MKNTFLNIASLAIVAVFSLLAIGSVNNAIADCVGKLDSYGYPLCAAEIIFNDTSGHEFEESIKYAQRNKIVKGYDDQTFRPDNPVNRAEFTKILVEAVQGQTPSFPSTACFPDVDKDIWFSPYVCFGKGRLFDGYPDGTFQPTNSINLAEAAKILTNSFSLSLPEGVSGEQWFGPYLEALAVNNAIPTSIDLSYRPVTRGEMVEMIMRLNENINNKPSLTSCDFIPQRCSEDEQFSGFGDDKLVGIDMPTVRAAWLAWYNNERLNAGLHEYRYNNQLNRSAYIWSDFSKDRGEITHKRPGQTAYYDYNIITQWFADLGLEFKNVQGVTYSENIGYGPFNCSESDCTDELIANIRSTFDFYMSEKDQSYRPHYNSVMNAYFKEIGLGITIDESQNRYYLTVHYGTELL